MPVKVLATATAAALIAVSAYADSHSMDRDNMIRSRDITDAEIYAVEKDFWDANDIFADAEMDEVGEVEDLVLDREGKLIGIVAEIGGFLDIGDKHVFLPIKEVKLDAVDDKEYRFVSPLTLEQLKDLEGLDEGWWD